MEDGAGAAEETREVGVLGGRGLRRVVDEGDEAGVVGAAGEGELLLDGGGDAVEGAGEGARGGEVGVELVGAGEGLVGEELGGKVGLGDGVLVV